MNHLSTGAKVKTLAVTMLAGLIAVSTTGCSNDLPTDAAEKLGADAVANQVVPTNDDFDNAETITTLPFTDADNTTEATTAPDDPVADCFGNGPTVWYEFTPSADILINANTFGSEYEAGIAVYTGTRGNLTQIACNDDFSPNVRFDAVGGETYFFMVGMGFFGSAAGGNLVFNVQQGLEVDLTIAPSGSVNSKTGIPTIRGTITCSRPADVRLIGHLEQRAGRVLITGGFDRSFACDGVTPWEAEAQVSGLFKGGQAEVLIFAGFFDFPEEIFLEESVTVNLKGKGK